MLRKTLAILSVIAVTLLPLAGCAGDGASTSGDGDAGASQGSDTNTTSE